MGGQSNTTRIDVRLMYTISLTNSVARILKKLHTSKGDYWIKQWFSSIAPLFKMGTFLKGKNLIPEGANSFP